MNSRGLLVSGALLATVGVASCAAHPARNAALPSSSPAATAPSPGPVTSASAPPPSASPTPCPSESGWTGQNLSTASPSSAAWLTAAQMPDAAVYHWSAQGMPAAMPFAQDVHESFVYGVGVDDFLAWQLLGYQGSIGGESAAQTIFLYASEAQAHCQYLSAVAEAASSQAQSRSFQVQLGLPVDAVTTQTVSGGDDSAWTESWTSANTDNTSAGPQTDVDYIAQVGTAVTFVGFDVPGLDESFPDEAAAQAVLSAIIQHLSIYASGS